MGLLLKKRVTVPLVTRLLKVEDRAGVVPLAPLMLAEGCHRSRDNEPGFLPNPELLDP